MSDRLAFEEDLPMVFTVKSFGEMFHCTHKTVYRMIESGELGCIRRERKAIKILRYHVTDWLGRAECNSSASKDGESGMSGGQLTAAQELHLQGPKIRARQNP